MTEYLAVRLLHILSATILFGTGLGTAFFMWQGYRMQNIQTIATVSRNVVLADWLFSMPAVVVQPLTGFWLVHLKGYDLSATWLWLTLLLYLVAGICWLPAVRFQIKMRNMACTAVAEDTPLPELYHRYMRLWLSLGVPAFTAMLIIFYLMVYRPG